MLSAGDERIHMWNLSTSQLVNTVSEEWTDYVWIMNDTILYVDGQYQLHMMKVDSIASLDYIVLVQ